MQFYQTRSHTIALFNTLPAICMEKVVYMKTGQDLYCKVHQSPRLPRVVLTSNSSRSEKNPPTITANKASSTGKLVAHFSRTHVASIPEKVSDWKYRETCRDNVDYRIPGITHSTVQNEDSNRKETVKRLIQQRKVEGVDHQHGQHGILRTLLDFLQDTMPGLRLALSTAHAASACSLQKGIDS